ncbi:MAG TPA: phosphopentomutase [Acidobacteriota bacterium]|nr:phosphopentomutase [Acidobacteriota bacterium]
MSRSFRRIIIGVLDSVGVGALPDAAEFGDAGSDTLGHVAEWRPLRIPRLARMGIGNIRPLQDVAPADSPSACYGKAALASRGKDTTSGHWEMMGLILEKPFPTYLESGFPAEVIEPFQQAIGRKVLGNKAASGTEIIAELGARHLETGRPIVYTSADSVFQIAAHEDVISTDELYRICEIARAQLRGEHEVGRVIARPFRGRPGSFVRTEGRKDYAIAPFRPTVLDGLEEADVPVVTVGKIASVFSYKATGRELKSGNNSATTRETLRALGESPRGLIFANWVDFDMLYGHRNNVEGYAKALEAFDRDLADLLENLQPHDLLILTSDHGCDPTTASTDHSREYTLVLAYSPSLQGGADLGTRATLADVGATVAENFSIEAPAGASFLQQLR